MTTKGMPSAILDICFNHSFSSGVISLGFPENTCLLLLEAGAAESFRTFYFYSLLLLPNRVNLLTFLWIRIISILKLFI
jgi:hypothetical protein